jgi:pimeloyl-ACP methyl ester carboxylesterase
MASPSARTRAAALQAPRISLATQTAADPPGAARPEAVLLLHGQPGGAADWAGVVARLPDHTEPVALNRPGWDGASRAVDLAGNAEAALAALDARGIDRAVVVGHSLGGAIAAWLAATHPGRVTALVLAAPAANVAALYPIDRWLSAPVAGELAGAATMVGLGLALSVPRLRRRIAGAAGLDPDYLVAARRTVLRPAAWRAYTSEQRTLVREMPELERRLGAIAVPTTIVAGADDRIVPLRAARELARQIPGARLSVSEHAGHLLPQRDPELVSEAIAAALAAASGSTLVSG